MDSSLMSKQVDLITLSSSGDEEDGEVKTRPIRVVEKDDDSPSKIENGEVKKDEDKEDKVEPPPPPPGPRYHVVKPGETLNSIAAFYDATPSQLAQINRISMSRLVFPGDRILVDPPPTPPAAITSPPARTMPAIPGMAVLQTPPSPTKPGQPRIPPKRHVVVEEEEITERNLVKINARHITDGNGVVLGSILVSPKTFMFNPNLTDLLVRENDQDFYQIIAPAELVVSAAIFKDFGRFNSTFGIATKEEDELLLYSPKEGEEGGEDEEEGKEDGKGDTTDEGDDGADVTFSSSKADDSTNSANNTSNNSSSSSKEDPMYLRLVMGKPIAKRLPRTTPIVSYGQQNLETEYWFIVNGRRRCRTLHTFFAEVFPKKYGLLDHCAIERSGYEVLRPGVKLLEEEVGNACNRETVAQIIRRNVTMTSFELPEMVGGESVIVQGLAERQLIAQSLPARTDGHNWHLAFSTTHDGFTLNSFYRKMHRLETSAPVMLLLEDVKGRAFGAYLTVPPKLSEHFTGTGESFVFKLRPEFRVFRWTGENEYFARGELQHLVVGSGNGAFALWIDEDLNQGRSVSCPTFDNEPLAIDEDFTLKAVECWAFEL